MSSFGNGKLVLILDKFYSLDKILSEIYVTGTWVHLHFIFCLKI